MQHFSRTDNTPVMEPHHWAIENIRTLSDLGDLSVAARIQVPYGVPDMLFNIYIEKGIAKVATRPYPSYMDKTWTEEFEIGQAKAVAMAFNAYWKIYQVKWRMIMDDFPHLFWTDNSDNLYVQIWDDVGTRLHLASDVVRVKAIRGWKNVSFPERDHGLIVAYIKTDGRPYYRNFCYQEVSDKFVWETEREIEEFTGTANTLNLFITNDYRTGIVIEDSDGKAFWFITERNWAGMAIPPESITVAPIKVEATLIPIEYPEGYETEHLSVAPVSVIYDLRYALTDNYFREIYNEPVDVYDEELEDYVEDWGKVLIFTTQNRLYSIDKADFVITDSKNINYYADTIAEIVNSDELGVYKYKLSFLDEKSFNDVDDVGVLKYIAVGTTTNGVDVKYDTFQKTFYPQNLVPTFEPVPEVDSIWNE